MSHSRCARRRVNILSSFRPSSLGLCFFLRALDWVDVILRGMSADVAWTLGCRLWRTLTEQQGAFVTSV